MLEQLFIFVLNMSLIGSYAIVFVLIARLLLKKAPKIFSYALWSIVLFRLICPFSFESVLSLMPTGKAPILQGIIYSTAPQINTGIAAVDSVVNPILPVTSNIGDSVNPIQIWLFLGAVVWAVGMVAMVIYSVAAFVKLKQSLIGAVQLKENIYLADHIPSPFVMGLFKPKIYLPSALLDSEKDFIIAHEMCHIRRFDHVTRILGFAALTVHWFNPLVWVAFIVSGKDMELSCDEAVMKKMSTDIRAEYSQSLLRLGSGKRLIVATPLAFGEGDTKSRVKNVLNYKNPAFWVIVISVIAVVAIGVGLAANPKEELIGKPSGFAGINAIILEIDKANLSMTVKGTDQNSAIGDKCIVDLKEASLITVATNSEPKSLSLDAFATGDTVVLFINEIQESYPTGTKATTVQLVATAPRFEHDYFIMTDEIGAIGCEYAVNKDNQLDTLQMLSALEALNGFKFDTDWALHGYIKFVFADKKPQDIFLRYCANVDDIWQQEYPIDSAEYKIKVPPKAGIYNFFADITWENGEQETSYFSVTVAEKQEEKPLALTKETATEFVNQALSTFKLNSDNTVSFTLPAVIPTNESEKTELFISASATFSPEPGTSSVQEMLDWKSAWRGGESYTEKLDVSRGKLTRLFLRVAFMTAEGENSYREYAANFIEFTEPFQFNTPVSVTDRSVEINEAGTSSVLKYTLQNGDNFSVTLTLPKGLTLSTSKNYLEYASTSNTDFPTVVAVKDGTPIGTLTLSSLGTADKDVLTQTDTAENTLPMQIFAPVALSNHAGFDNYKVCKSSATGANATAKYLWQDLTDYAGNAPAAPWLKSDCILAYDYEKIPFFINLNLTNDSLRITELENLAKSIDIMG